jgi:hypothetical protein
VRYTFKWTERGRLVEGEGAGGGFVPGGAARARGLQRAGQNDLRDPITHAPINPKMLDSPRREVQARASGTFWMNPSYTVLVVADTVSLGRAQPDPSRPRTAEGLPAAKWVPVDPSKFPMECRWNFYIGAKQAADCDGAKRGNVEMDFWYDVEIVIPENRKFTDEEIKNKRTSTGEELKNEATTVLGIHSLKP